MRPTLRTRDDSPSCWRNIDACNRLFMTFQFMLKSELASRPIVELDVVISCDCQHLPVGGEGMVGNGIMEKVMDFRRSHYTFPTEEVLSTTADLEIS